MGVHMYVHSDNAEEVLQEAIQQIKNKSTWDSRKQAFKDCTEYWKGEVLHIIGSDLTDSEKLEIIKNKFDV